MMQRFVCLVGLVVGLATPCFAEPLYSEGKLVVVDPAGTIVSLGSFSEGAPRALRENEYPMDYAFPTNDIRYWKKSGNDIIAMTPEEQATVDDAEKESVVADEGISAFEDALLGYLADKDGKTKKQIRDALKAKVDKNKKRKKDSK